MTKLMLRPAGGVRSAAKKSVSSGSAGICHQCSIASKWPSNHSWLMLVPSCSEIDMSDADVAELALQHLRDVLAHREARLRDQREGKPPPVALADAVAVGVAPAGFVEERARGRRIERVDARIAAVRPRHRLNRTVRDRRQAVEDRSRDEIAIDRLRQRPPHANVGEGGEPPLVERDVLVGVAGGAMDRRGPGPPPSRGTCPTALSPPCAPRRT